MITVLGDRVLVALRPELDEVVSEGGIVLARDPDRVKTPTQGIVMALGERPQAVGLDDVIAVVDALANDGELCHDTLRAALKRLGPAPFDVQVGDCVLFPRSAGEQVTDAGVHYVILYESEIIGIVPELNSEAA